MSIIKGLFIALKNLRVIPFNEMTPEIHDTLGSNLAKVMMVAKMSDAKLTKAQREYVVNQAKQLQEFEDRYITGIKDKSGNVIKSDEGIKDTKSARIFNRMGEELDPKKPIVGGTQQGKKIDQDTFRRLAERGPQLIKQKIADRKINEVKDVKQRIDSGVAATVERILAMDPVDAMKEASSVIGRKGQYKNLSEQDAKKILQDTEDHIFERNIKPKETDMDFDDNDFAVGGRVGFKKGNGVADEEAENARFVKRVRELMDEGFDMGEAVREAMKEGYANGGRIGFKGGADMATVAGDTTPARKGSVNVSSSGDVTFNPGGKDDPFDDRSTFEQTINQRNIVDKSKKPKKSFFKNLYDVGQDFNYLRNLAIGNFPGIGKQLLFDLGKRKFLDNQAMLDEEGIVNGLPENQFAELNPLGLIQMRNLEKKKGMAPLDSNINFTEEDQKMLEELQKRDADPNKIYGPILKAANGGRIGFKKGMDRRTFMKIMGGLTTLPIVGKFFKGAEVAAPVVEKAAEAASGAPPYFFNLVNRIRALGKKFDGPKERSETYKYKDYEMQVDNDTGQIEISKQNLGYDERFGEGIVSEEYMSFKPGRADETTGGKKVADEYEENTGFTDKDGELKDVEPGVSEETVMDGSISKEELEQEIIEQLSKEASSIKKAGGGIARMLGE